MALHSKYLTAIANTQDKCVSNQNVLFDRFVLRSHCIFFFIQGDQSVLLIEETDKLRSIN